MNNITQVKRGSTASWSLGPELVHWENLDVWGKDSLIHCEGTDLEMNVYTASANYFYDENGQLEDFKRPGLWLIKNGEIDWDMGDEVVFKCHVEGPSDCWLEVYSSGISAVHGQQIPLNAGTVEMTVPYLGDWGIYMRWPEQRENVETARVKMSIRVKDAYEELAPGQLGIEYNDNGRVKLKAGMPHKFKWNELPYINAHDHFYVVSPSGATNVFNYWTIQTTIDAMDFEAWCNSDLNLFGFTYNETGVRDPNGDLLFLTRDEAINQENPISPSDTIQLYYTYYTG